METNQYGYARMPRIIRKGYKHLTKLQKLLYIYLRDLCGESGTCYRSLRTLAEETDFSIGYLSENIPLLEQAGLIRAEKKKHNNQKWEIWHIVIVDIWEENAKFLQTEKCSQDEQISSVHDVNCSRDEQNTPESVHGMNEMSQKCSHGANNREKNLNENPLLTEKESTAVSLPDFFFQCSGKRPKKSKRNEGYWEKLAPDVRTLEDMQSLYDFVSDKIKDWDDPTVQPGNLVGYLDEWKQSRRALVNPIKEAQEERAAETPPEPIYREHAPLPADMRFWIDDLTRISGDGQNKQENRETLERMYQHTTCPDEQFFNALIDAEGQLSEEVGHERMQCFFMRLRTQLGLEVIAV